MFARRLSKNRSMADDLVQETVLRAFAHADQFIPGTNLFAWLSVILRNCYFNERRSAVRLVSLDVTGDLPTPSIDSPQETRMNLSDVARRFDVLTSNQRQALTLVAANGYSYEDAAKQAGCVVGTMKSRVSRARTSLEQLLTTPTPKRTVSYRADYDHLDAA